MRNSIAIMQPYFLPYLGYWQLINAVDSFIILDNLKYVKQSWINRNRYIGQNSNINYFSINLKKSSDYDNINKKIISDKWIKNKKKYLKSIKFSYKDSINFKDGFSLINKIFNYETIILSDLIFYSICEIKKYLDIKTTLIKSSDLNLNDYENKQEFLVQICRKFNANNYINSENGQKLYSKKYFLKKNINLFFLKKKKISYSQNSKKFIDNLSIVDLLMNNEKKNIIEYLNEFKII